MSGSLAKAGEEIIWERLNKAKKWLPYSSDVSRFIERAFDKNLTSVCLGDVDPKLKLFTVNIKDLVQTSQLTGTKCAVRRRIMSDISITHNQVIWEWRGDSKRSWHCYSADITSVLENAYKAGDSTIDLSSSFPGYYYTVDFTKMVQVNNFTKYHRPIRRIDGTSGTQFPLLSGFEDVDSESSSGVYLNGLEKGMLDEPAHVKTSKSKKPRPLSKKMNQLWKKIGIGKGDDSDDEDDETSSESFSKKLCSPPKDNGSSLLAATCVPKEDEPVPPVLSAASTLENDGQSAEKTVYALVYGKPWKYAWPPHTPQSEIKPVPGIDPLPMQSSSIKKSRKKKGSRGNKSSAEPAAELDVFTEFTEQINTVNKDERCLICYEDLQSGSSYDDDSALLRLKLCSHVFHKSCVNAMYESGNKDNHLQCPTCKTIHGVKCGNQPPGTMTYHVLPYSLPGHPDRDTIQIIYDIKPGVQGSEHPNPGRRYTTRGFPRICYLPDNEMGRKILRLLIKAWERRLIFTVGSSSTTGETDTVTWNEIHHKTEFGFNKHGHGYPDPSYFENVIAELAAHGVTDSTPARIPTDL